IECSEIFENETLEKEIVFIEPGEQMVYFNLNVKEKVGAGKIKVLAQCGREKASQEVEIEIRNPNPPKTVE
ncbi:MAG: hypothetical protein JXR31_02040, partial [Prolixibacteraceae bacterium]|nr:hypothetical protein [Prolixibacteraceae bacterium]